MAHSSPLLSHTLCCPQEPAGHQAKLSPDSAGGPWGSLGGTLLQALPSWEVCAHSFQELNDGFLPVVPRVLQVLQPQLQLLPGVLKHARVPQDLSGQRQARSAGARPMGAAQADGAQGSTGGPGLTHTLLSRHHGHCGSTWKGRGARALILLLSFHPGNEWGHRPSATQESRFLPDFHRVPGTPAQRTPQPVCGPLGW